jgi:formate/nitrite transporter FocA (FNT family)
VRRHRFDPFSLLFGALFAGIGLSYLLGSTIADTKRVIWPMFSVIVGGTIVAWGVTTIVRQQRPVTSAEQDVEPDVEDAEEPPG